MVGSCESFHPRHMPTPAGRLLRQRSRRRISLKGRDPAGGTWRQRTNNRRAYRVPKAADPKNRACATLLSLLKRKPRASTELAAPSVVAASGLRVQASLGEECIDSDHIPRG